MALLPTRQRQCACINSSNGFHVMCVNLDAPVIHLQVLCKDVSLWTAKDQFQMGLKVGQCQRQLTHDKNAALVRRVVFDSATAVFFLNRNN